jgi:hypothetical protein
MRAKFKLSALMFLKPLIFAAAMSCGSVAQSADRSPLADFAGEWAVKPNLCGKEPLLDNTFPLNISKDGLEVGVFEQRCDVVKAKKQTDTTFMVRTSCEGEGESYFVNEVFQFGEGKLKIIDKEQGTTRLFYQCSKPKAVVKEAKSAPRADAAKIIRGRCHMDSCNFYKLGKVRREQKTKTGQLVVSEYFGASVDVPPVEGDGNQYANVKLPSFVKSKPLTVITHCAKERAFAATKMQNGKWFGEMLNLPVGGGAVRAESLSLYWAICHDLYVGADELWQRRKEFKKFGYNWEWPGENDQIEFESMDDIIVFAKR